MSIFKPKAITNKTIDEFVDDNIKLLESRARKNKILWRFLSSLTAIVNITILSISGYLLYFLLETYFLHRINQTWFEAIGPQLLIVGMTMLLFPLTFITIIYRSKMNATKYKDAFEEIQYLTIEYIEHAGIFSSKDRDHVYKKEIKKITTKGMTKDKKNVSYKGTWFKILLGDN